MSNHNIRVEVTGLTLTEADDYRNSRELALHELGMLRSRYSAGEDGRYVVDQDGLHIESTGPAQGEVRTAGEDGSYKAYHFGGEVDTITSQEFRGPAIEPGELMRYQQDFNGAAAWSQVHAVLFELNDNAPLV
jgi:hypothetical protein